ncbi:MAG TPA: hypothetical protein VN176_06005 [Verrucomicrobiae bacterium]|nr:hypothetical protein [Verrucomicrobiae bacterium]
MSSERLGPSRLRSLLIGKMTIFGFNTDVKLGDTVYHVQTEAQQRDLLLQTLVFVKGQCVAKRAFSYAHKVSQPGFSDASIHELLKMQHKTMVDAFQSGQGPTQAASVEIQDIGSSGLAVTVLKIENDSNEGQISLQVQVTDTGRPVAGVSLKCWACGVPNPPPLAQTITGVDGQAEMRIPVTAEVLRDSAVMMQATGAEKSATRKFRFKK